MSEEVKVEAAAETEAEVKFTKKEAARLVKKYDLTHAGNGRWKIGKEEALYADKQSALEAAVRKEAEELEEAELGDVIPKGYHNWKTTDHRLIRGSVMELPMNERYLADGSVNPLYDREWLYGWAYKDRQDISRWRSKGYKPVDPKEFREGVRDGNIPERVGDLVYEEGSFMAYGDAILMKIPRFIQRQNEAEIEKANIKNMTTQHAQDDAFYRRDSAHIPDDYVSKIGLQNSLEYVEL